MWRLHPKPAPEEIVGRTETAREWTSAARFEWRITRLLNIGIQMIGRQRQAIEIFNDRRVRIAQYFAGFSVGNARNCSEVCVAEKCVEHTRQRLFSFTTNNQVDKGKALQRCHINDGRLWSTQYDRSVR